MGNGCFCGVLPNFTFCKVCTIAVCNGYSCIYNMHLFGPYNNVYDRKISQFIGVPFVKLNHKHKGESFNTDSLVTDPMLDHQESWSPMCTENKNAVQFDKHIGFVTNKTILSNLPCSLPVDMNDPSAYLRAVDLVVASGVPNYKCARIPLTSGFNWEYIEHHIQDYHDKIILDYIKYGFPLSIMADQVIESGAKDNHSSAKAYSGEVSQFISEELEHKALLGPFDQIPHSEFTWAPLMTRPKGSGRLVILDLSYGDFSLNKATNRLKFDDEPFSLKLPSLDHILSHFSRNGDPMQDCLSLTSHEPLGM